MNFLCVNKVNVLNNKAYSAANSTANHLILKNYNLISKPVPLRNSGFMEEKNID